MPGYQASRTAFDVGEPGHGDGAAGFENDDGVGIGGGDGVDESVLIVGEREVWSRGLRSWTG